MLKWFNVNVNIKILEASLNDRKLNRLQHIKIHFVASYKWYIIDTETSSVLTHAILMMGLSAQKPSDKKAHSKH